MRTVSSNSQLPHQPVVFGALPLARPADRGGPCSVASPAPAPGAQAAPSRPVECAAASRGLCMAMRCLHAVGCCARCACVVCFGRLLSRGSLASFHGRRLVDMSVCVCVLTVSAHSSKHWAPPPLATLRSRPRPRPRSRVYASNICLIGVARPDGPSEWRPPRRVPARPVS